MKKLLSALLVLLLMLMPLQALAANVSISFTTDVAMMYVGMSGNLKVNTTGVSESKLKWSSDQSSVISAKGSRLSAHKQGLAVVSAAYGKTKAKLAVVVVPRSLSLDKNGTHQLPYNRYLTYGTTNKKVATVSATGLVTGLSKGTANIKVAYQNKTATIPVTVSAGAPGTENSSRAASLACANQTDQIVLVEHGKGSNCTVSLHEKKDGVWTEVLSSYGYLGKNGIGKTKEGDKKTPTGTYNLTTPFGIKDDPGTILPYTKVTKYHYWCGSSSSKYYNQFIDTRVINRKVTSADEYLINYKGVYNYCLFIDYNKNGTPKKGSCIFLHCTGSNKYTAGCVAVPEKIMKQIITRVHKGCKIVIQ